MVDNPIHNNTDEKKIFFSEQRTGRFALGFVLLDSPSTLNALDVEMLHLMEEKLLEWREREDIACVVFHSASERAFCAGGNAKSLVFALQEDRGISAARELFTIQYFVDYLIHVYPKPTLCWADGITMGGASAS